MNMSMNIVLCVQTNPVSRTKLHNLFKNTPDITHLDEIDQKRGHLQSLYGF